MELSEEEHSRKVKLILADDHEFIRKAISSYLNTLGSNFEVIGEAANGIELFQLIKKVKPDIVILDLEMPEMNGFEVLKQLQKNKLTDIRVIVLSGHYNEFYFKELVMLGAASYLPKSCSSEEFLRTVKEVVAHGFYITKAVSKSVIKEFIKHNQLN